MADPRQIEAASTAADSSAAPSVPPMTKEQLQAIRILKDQGALDKIPEDQRGPIADRLEETFAKERIEVLNAGPTLGEKAATVGATAGRGVLRNVPPYSVLTTLGMGMNLVNKLNPYSQGRAPETMEEWTASIKFPLVRGAELAARMFVPQDQRPDLTTYAELVKEQIGIDTALRASVPGVQEGVELGIGIGSLGSLALAAKNAYQKYGPRVVRNVATMVAERKATAAQAKVLKLRAQLLREGDGPIGTAILNSPEKILQKVESGQDLNLNDIGLQLVADLDEIQTKLGAKVGTYRQAALADRSQSVVVPPELPEMLSQLKRNVTFSNGESALKGKIADNIDQVERIAKLGRVTPADLVLLTDSIDEALTFGKSGQIGSNIVQKASQQLLDARRLIKETARMHNSRALAEAADIERAARVGKPSTRAIGQVRKEIAFQLWADADDNYSKFAGVHAKIAGRVKESTAEALTQNLFTKNKTQLRNDLAEALDYMAAIDPTAVGHGEAFFDNLAQIRAAQKIQTGMLAAEAAGNKMPVVPGSIDRVVQQGVTDIVQRWEKAGEGIAGTIGGAMGYVGSTLLDLGTSGDLVGAGAAGWALKLAGAMAGRHVGLKMADPRRVLHAAIKSKALSLEARQLASDMVYITDKIGADGNIALLNLIGPIPAVNELMGFVTTKQNQTEATDNAK